MCYNIRDKKAYIFLSLISHEHIKNLNFDEGVYNVKKELTFRNPEFERLVRNKISITNRPVWVSDALKIIELDLSYFMLARLNACKNYVE